MNKFNLNTPIEKIFLLKKNIKEGLEKLDIETVKDLLYYFPKRYEKIDNFTNINDIRESGNYVIYGKISRINIRKTYGSKIPISEAHLEDSTGKIKIIWFSQPYIGKMLKEGSVGRFTGKVSKDKKGSFLFSNPEFENIKEIPMEKSGKLFSAGEEDALTPVYKETRYITSKWIRESLKKIFREGNFSEINDFMPEGILKKYNLPVLKDALIFIHRPKKNKDIQVAKKRFSFEEIFLIQIVRQVEKQKFKDCGAFSIKSTKILEDKFLNNLDFSLTKAQENVIKDIKKDFLKESPMSRLLEGDVGCGKTVVAAFLSFLVSNEKPKNQNFGKLQTAYMAPTEILATQIFDEFIKLMKNFNISIGLITGKKCYKFPSKIKDGKTKVSKAQLLKWVENGEIQILIGTHALISKKVLFENLGFIIIDEQHKFGKKQRQALRQKGLDKKEKKESELAKKVKKKGLADNKDIMPHLLSMTATPIPRTLALTLYGDLDLSVIDEYPKGRKEVKTKFALEKDRTKVYSFLEKSILDGKQAYVVCPRIEEGDSNNKNSLITKSVSTELENLKKIFPKFKIAGVHSKLAREEKEKILEDFYSGKIDILVSTSVIEVGVNVPNSTTIIIEGSERFGLAQLHQLRGRVRRSKDQGYCFLFASNEKTASTDRLNIFSKSSDGFFLAEQDMKTRGAGEMLGNKQWGISDISMEAISNLKMVSCARLEAQDIVSKDKLNKLPALKTKILEIENKLYLE